jgi:hypothetical protein
LFAVFARAIPAAPVPEAEAAPAEEEDSRVRAAPNQFQVTVDRWPTDRMPPRQIKVHVQENFWYMNTLDLLLSMVQE